MTAALLWATVGCAAPHVPASDDVVLEHLPPALIAVLKIAPRRSTTPDALPALDAAVAAARHFVEIGQTYSDPRAYGYAEAALGGWWTKLPAPDDVLILRARILQFRHQFDAAIQLLEAALQHDQFNPDAWLLLASIEQVRGNVAASRAACLKLIPMADPLVGAACVAATAGMTAHARDGVTLLANALQQPTATSPNQRAWAWTILAELQDRIATTPADDGAAEADFRSALAAEPQNIYSRAAFADFLLDHDRAGEVRAVLGDATQADALLLRAAIAAHRVHDADAAALADNLRARFAEARDRGDETHLREQARFELDVQQDAPRALELARRNFEIQREPADARLLLDAALAAGQPRAADAATRWLRQTGIDAPALSAAASRLGEPSAQ